MKRKIGLCTFLFRSILFCFLIVGTPVLGYSKIVWPTDANAVIEIFHVYKDPLLQVGIQSTGNVYAVTSGFVSFVTQNTSNKQFIEIINDQNIRIGYIGLVSDVVVGQRFEEGQIIGNAPLDEAWYLRMFDDNFDIWIDPLQVLPPAGIDNTFRVKLIDFEFVYPYRNKDGSIKEFGNTGNVDFNDVSQVLVRQIQKRMFSGDFRLKITIDIQEKADDTLILPGYLFVEIAQYTFVFTREDMMSHNRDETSDVVSIKNNKIYFLLPIITLPRGYHNIRVTSRGPLNINKKFKFSIFAL